MVQFLNANADPNKPVSPTQFLSRSDGTSYISEDHPCPFCFVTNVSCCCFSARGTALCPHSFDSRNPVLLIGHSLTIIFVLFEGKASQQRNVPEKLEGRSK